MAMRTRRRALVLLCVLLLSSLARAQTQPRTWRLDFYETGGPGVEAYSFDRLVIEPLAWPDNPGANVETQLTGNYRFEVIEAGGRVVFARGYDPAFAEWLTTAEAKKIRRSFQDSLRFPAVTTRADVVLKKRSEDGNYKDVWRHAIDPADPFIDRSTPARQVAIEIERHGEPSRKVDLLLLGDGYTAAECARFRTQAIRLSSALFRVEPFKSRRADFNVWGICPPSAESGIASPSRGIFRRTPVGAAYDAFGSERYILTFENRAWRDIAAWAPYEYVIILTNGATYGGGGLYNVYSTAAAGNDFAEYLFIHEFGHHFAGLADEYYTSPVAYEPPEKIAEPWAANTTSVTDRGKLKWRELLTPGVPLPTPWPKQPFDAMQKEYQETRAKLSADKLPES